MMSSVKAGIFSVDYYLPTTELTDEFTSDLAVGAARCLFESQSIDPQSVDYLIVCTQTPDFFLPTTACLVQDALGLRTEIGAVDINLGCSGYIYSLGVAKGLVESEQVDNVLIITADKTAGLIFGDPAAATLIMRAEGRSRLSGFAYGSDGAGAPHLRGPDGGRRSELVIAECVEQVLTSTNTVMGDVDLFVLHQANTHVIEQLSKKLGIPSSKFAVAVEDVGNAGSSTIPIALARAEASGAIVVGSRILIVGFGDGSSWGGALLEWG